jgi:hypothetical protein
MGEGATAFYKPRLAHFLPLLQSFSAFELSSCLYPLHALLNHFSRLPCSTLSLFLPMSGLLSVVYPELSTVLKQ